MQGLLSIPSSCDWFPVEPSPRVILPTDRRGTERLREVSQPGGPGVIGTI